MPVTAIHEDGRLAAELSGAGNRLVVVDFTATWCGPCQRIAPIYEQLSNKYASVLFLKVDVDECPQTTASNNVSSMPTFQFFRNKQRLGTISGADPTGLEAKIVELIGTGDAAGGVSDSGVPGHMDLNVFLQKNELECLNESDHTLHDALTVGSDKYLESDCDEQLIISMGFSQNVKLHSLRLDAPAGQGPKTVKIFANQPQTLDFDKADSMEPVQILELSAKQLTSKEPIPLKYVKFQNVSNVQLFVKDNQTGAETTVIHFLGFIGSPVVTTNMNDFKRISGKKGETHS